LKRPPPKKSDPGRALICVTEALKYLHHASSLLRTEAPQKSPPAYYETNRAIALVEQLEKNLQADAPKEGSA